MKQRTQNKRREQTRIKYVSEDSDELEDDEIVVQIKGTGAKPFMMEGLMSGKEFKAIIDTGSPVSIFAVHELKKLIGKHWSWSEK